MPDQMERRRRRPVVSPRSLNMMLPSILTLIGLCAGISAIRYALSERWDYAVIAILVAAVLDGLDGRMARALGTSSRFGAELDSLSDFACFGVAPALIIYLWGLQGAGGLAWAVALLFAVCCALRLARFNSELDPDPDEERPAWAANFFKGVPAPAGAGLALLPLIASLQIDPGAKGHPVANGLVLLAVSALMVSRVPTFAAKKVKIPAPYIVFVLIGVGAFIAFMISEPWLTMLLVGLLYLGSIPFAVRRYTQLQRESEARRAKTAEQQPAPEQPAPEQPAPEQSAPEQSAPEQSAPEQPAAGSRAE